VVGQAVSSANFQATNRKLRNEPKASNHPLIESSSLGKICEDR
jgi:hypothetical protein